MGSRKVGGLWVGVPCKTERVVWSLGDACMGGGLVGIQPQKAELHWELFALVH